MSAVAFQLVVRYDPLRICSPTALPFLRPQPAKPAILADSELGLANRLREFVRKACKQYRAIGELVELGIGRAPAVAV